MSKKKTYTVSLYNRVYYTQEVEAKSEEEAAQKLWEQGPDVLDLPAGFSLEDPSAWEVDW